MERKLLLPLVLGLVALLAPPALSSSVSTNSALTLGFSVTTPSTSTGMSLQIIYRGPNPKPPAVTHLDIVLPAGTSFDTSAVPVCTASDLSLMIFGRLACPAASQVGTGSIQVVTGFGPPIDPIDTDVVVYNGTNQFIEVAMLAGTDIPLASDRVYITAGHLIANPPVLPGGPPDFHTAVSALNIQLYGRGRYLTTPTSCPPTHAWNSTAVFDFSASPAQTATATTPCRAR